VCNKCKKEFDSTATLANVILSLCSLCNAEEFQDEQGAKKSNDLEEADVEKPNDDNLPGADNDSEAEVVAVNLEGEVEEEEKGLVDVFTSNECLPTSADIHDTVTGYTGFTNGKDLNAFMAASVLACQQFSALIGALGMQEFHQNHEPGEYSTTGKKGWFKFTIDPYLRSKKLVMYGYDLYDAVKVKGPEGIGMLCMSMIMTENEGPSGYILVKLGKTRCVRPRTDGFLYHIRENT
jgi:hypothetical protein